MLPIVFALLFSGTAACSLFFLPPLEDQKASLLSGDIRLRSLSSQAFIEVWGPPTYERREQMQFFVVDSGMYIPRFRVPLGESPPGWDSMMASGEAYFLGYAERGELLGFLEGRLVYREQMPAEQIHAVGKQWKKEDLFKTKPETPPRPPQ
ncbi:MAG: hypothetical protein HY581_02390 [Nitrospirae bacterium]|nr:hypothetical protein [Nitrospirota bacterium]